MPDRAEIAVCAYEAEQRTNAPRAIDVDRRNNAISRRYSRLKYTASHGKLHSRWFLGGLQGGWGPRIEARRKIGMPTQYGAIQEESDRHQWLRCVHQHQ